MRLAFLNQIKALRAPKKLTVQTVQSLRSLQTVQAMPFKPLVGFHLEFAFSD
jgi:hypothetical protein